MLPSNLANPKESQPAEITQLLFQSASKGADRPAVTPAGSTNLAFIGQFAEVPEDVVFTVEYSVRTAWAAVATLLKLKKGPPPVYHGQYDPRVLVHALETMHRK